MIGTCLNQGENCASLRSSQTVNSDPAGIGRTMPVLGKTQNCMTEGGCHG